MLSLDHVSKTYKVGLFGGKELRAVRDVTFQIQPGEVVSLIGESGSGKSTIGKMILRLLPVNGGSITVDDQDISALKGAALRDYYRVVQGVFQDPFSSFNPMFKVDHLFQILRPTYFGDLSDAAWRERAAASLHGVGLEPGQVVHKYPHQLSGGQLQRLLIARALMLETRYLVADEIISMLDASTRIDVLNLLADLKARGLGVLFVTHDLSLGNYISERTVILRHGRIVEMGRTAAVFGDPRHPYTRQLLAAVPHLRDRWGDRGEVASAWAAGRARDDTPCAYHADPPPPTEDGSEPLLTEIAPGHLVACRREDDDPPCS